MIFWKMSAVAPVLLDLDAGNEEEAITAMVKALGLNSALASEGEFIEAVLERQKNHPPLMGNEIAFPHARTAQVKEIVLAMARLMRPIPFGPGGTEVRLVFLYGIPLIRIADHLEMTALLARRLRDRAVVEALLAASDADHFRDILE